MSSDPAVETPSPEEPRLESARRSGILFVISAPSGAGKSTLTKLLLSNVKGLEYSVSTTTRPMRPGERDGVDYLFTDEETFLKLIQNGEFIEHAVVHGNRYGTRRATVDQTLARSVDILLDIDVQGARQIRGYLKELSAAAATPSRPGAAAGTPDGPAGGGGARVVFPAVFAFIMPPSMKVLENRLRNRRTDSDETIERRLRNAEREMGLAKEYDYIIVNDDVEAAAGRLAEIVKVERTKALGAAIRAEAALRRSGTVSAERNS
jgi:guanylate kinase